VACRVSLYLGGATVPKLLGNNLWCAVKRVFAKFRPFRFALATIGVSVTKPAAKQDTAAVGRDPSNSGSKGKRLARRLNRIIATSGDPTAAKNASVVLGNLHALGPGRSPAVRLYINLVRQRMIDAADFAMTHLLPHAAVETAQLWPWRLLHLAQMGDEGQFRQHLGNVPTDIKLPFVQWRRIASECQNQRIACGSTLRALLKLNLPAELSVPALLAAPIDAPPDFAMQRINKIVGIRKAIGVGSSPSFHNACQRAEVLEGLLLTYALDAVEPHAFGRDCMLPFVTIKENPSWTACLANGRPFVLAGFHAGPTIDGSWPARSARIPLFHFAQRHGNRTSPNLIPTENITAAEFVAIAREIVRAPAGVIMSPDVSRGMRDSGLMLGDHQIALSPFTAYIAHRMRAQVFFTRSKWTADGISVEVISGPRATSSLSSEVWEKDFNAAYAAQMKIIVAGDGLDNFRH
jgi:hypothetical protein